MQPGNFNGFLMVECRGAAVWTLSTPSALPVVVSLSRLVEPGASPPGSVGIDHRDSLATALVMALLGAVEARGPQDCSQPQVPDGRAWEGILSLGRAFRARSAASP